MRDFAEEKWSGDAFGVMPAGLKDAPSIFSLSATRILETVWRHGTSSTAIGGTMRTFWRQCSWGLCCKLGAGSSMSTGRRGL